MTVDGLARKEQYLVWFHTNLSEFETEVQTLTDAWVVLNAISFHALTIPNAISDSSGGVMVRNSEHDPWIDLISVDDRYMKWEEFEAAVQDLMEVQLQRVERYHYPTIKKYMDRVLSGEKA